MVGYPNALCVLGDCYVTRLSAFRVNGFHVVSFISSAPWSMDSWEAELNSLLGGGGGCGRGGVAGEGRGGRRGRGRPAGSRGRRGRSRSARERNEGTGADSQTGPDTGDDPIDAKLPKIQISRQTLLNLSVSQTGDLSGQNGSKMVPKII